MVEGRFFSRPKMFRFVSLLLKIQRGPQRSQGEWSGNATCWRWIYSSSCPSTNRFGSCFMKTHEGEFRCLLLYCQVKDMSYGLRMLNYLRYSSFSRSLYRPRWQLECKLSLRHYREMLLQYCLLWQSYCYDACYKSITNGSYLLGETTSSGAMRSKERPSS